jgi:ribosomal protein L3 glutamine methyltransferase
MKQSFIRFCLNSCKARANCSYYASIAGVRSQTVRYITSSKTNKGDIRKEASSQKELSNEFSTIFDIYRYAVTQFTKNELQYGQSTSSAWEDASFLIFHELALPYEDPIDKWKSARLTSDERKHLLSIIQERTRTRKPLPYLLNGCYQQGEYFYVDERALIPRSFIGEIIVKQWCKKDSSALRYTKKAQTSDSLQLKPEQQLELGYDDYFGEITDESKFLTSTTLAFPSSSSLHSSSLPLKNDYNIDISKIRTVLDLCTGSGCLAIIAAKNFPNVRRVDALDISSDALEVARINVDQKGLDKTVKLYHGDLFKGLPQLKAKNKYQYDLIITNPPYVKKAIVKTLPEEYKHEPTLALDGGHDGLNIVKKILVDAFDYLSDDGYLLCEIGDNKTDFIQYYKKENPELLESIQWMQTENSTDEVFLLSKKSWKKGE